MGKFKVGLLVWAKMKSFPAWPGKVIDPEDGKKEKKKHHYIFFFGSENYAWVPDEGIFPYADNREKFIPTKRIPNGFKEAVDAIDDALKKNPENARMSPVEINEVSSTTAPKSVSKTASKPKQMKEKSEKTTEKKMGRPKGVGSTGRPKKRAGSPVITSPATAPKKGKISREYNHKEIVRSSMPNSPDTSVSQVNYQEYMAAMSLPEPKDRVASSSSAKTKARDPFTPDFMSSICDIPSKDSIIATPLKIGFLGLGLMGSGMVLNLLRSGHEVTVWNRTPSKCKDFIKDGALKGNSPADVVLQCDITFSSVSDPAALKDLVFGNCGVLQGISEGKGYVDLSTIDVETAGDVNEAITARGGLFLEAPVIGSKGQAAEGSLVILAAGDQSLYEDCYSCFAAMGKKTYFIGETGCASKMKLVLNLLRGTVIAGLAESLALAEKIGLHTDEVMQILMMDPVACPLIKSHATDMLNSNYNEPKCKLQIMQKDLRLAVNMSDSVDQPLHVGAAVNELFKKAKAKGYGEHDVTAVYRAADL